jgi:hypothetical protein
MKNIINSLTPAAPEKVQLHALLFLLVSVSVGTETLEFWGDLVHVTSVSMQGSLTPKLSYQILHRQSEGPCVILNVSHRIKNMFISERFRNNIYGSPPDTVGHGLTRECPPR